MRTSDKRSPVTFRRTAAYRKAVDLVRKLKDAGHEALLVGGCVRDLLMGRSPKDFDIATSAVPEQVAALFPRIIPVGVQFGVQIVVSGGYSFEVATFRTDLSYKDGRHPEGVRFSTPEEDALRRDFTVNGIFFDPVGQKVIDYVGGRADLKKKLIRAIGNPAKRFQEDRLRMLRAVRFASVLDFRIDPATFRAICRLARGIGEVSRERVRDELVKLFTGPHPGRGLSLLDESGLLAVILPEVAKMKGVQQPPEFHPEGDVFVHTRILLDRLKKPSTVLAFAGLLHDVGKPPTFRVADRIRFDGHDRVGASMAKRICRELRFSNAETEAISEIIGDHMKFKDVRRMRLSTLKRFMALGTFEEQLAMHRADCLASHGDLSNWRFLRKKQKELSSEELKPEPLIKGGDLLEMGFPEGPAIGKILKAVEEKQLEGDLKSKESALSWVQKEFRR
ncbi:MAG: CCA tRNA nucleotidyltransferase [Candidatus Omnitrophica bacterium]|nr:CCA tRNA nucleotidyltransferase [Candidatus Omnitrophota bacterium]